MLIHFKIDTMQFINTTHKTQISVDVELERCPNEDERIEIETKEGRFYGIITSVETYINIKENKIKYYVHVDDKTIIND